MTTTTLNQKSKFPSDTYIDITLQKYLIIFFYLKCNACRIFLLTFWVNIHCPFSPLYCEITEFMKSGERKRCTVTFCQLAYIRRFNACMALKYRHKNSMHTMERLVAPLNKSATFSKHPAQ